MRKQATILIRIAGATLIASTALSPAMAAPLAPAAGGPMAQAGTESLVSRVQYCASFTTRRGAPVTYDSTLHRCLPYFNANLGP
jgi:hypothetical protein